MIVSSLLSKIKLLSLHQVQAKHVMVERTVHSSNLAANDQIFLSPVSMVDLFASLVLQDSFSAS